MGKTRLFSGVQPSGELHIGNYIGAIKQFTELQDKYDSFFCVVDYHAITVPQDPKILKKNIRAVINAYLALGIDPKKATIFVQSDVPEHTELSWILNTISKMGELGRMTQYKDKAKELLATEEGEPAGLFNYPVLMAADILLYDSSIVPVSKDQQQHIELTRTLAERFNKRFGKTFAIPEGRIYPLVMGLNDPTKKMSKSALSSANYISLFDNEDSAGKKIMKAVTDSGGKYSGVEPGISNLLGIYAEFAGVPVESARKKFKGKKYSEFKTKLADVVVDFLSDFQKKYNKLANDNKYADKVLKEGAARARAVASKKLEEVKEKIGVGS